MISSTFERQECKYWVTPAQMRAILDIGKKYITPDEYGQYEIRSVYFDTDDFALIRASIEKPPYKEKLRLRSYGKADDSSAVFLELKKKYMGVVYKRRADLTLAQSDVLLREGVPPRDTQILREIEAFRTRFHVSPKAFIAYERTAFCGANDPDLRVTFDSNIRFRRHTLRLDRDAEGISLGLPGMLLMELKVAKAFPLWLSWALSNQRVFPASFSKYGDAYTNYILPNIIECGAFETEAARHAS